MNELALFAGAGGGILGGHLLGWRTVCAVEWEPYPASVLCARQNDGILPPFPIWDDVQTFDGFAWRGLVDVVSGGFPCQDISAAGKGAGIDGERSGMWHHMARVVGEVRPRYVFVENSPMLVTRGLERVLGDLTEMGYDTKWTVMGAADVGANHQRDRIWIVGKLANSTQLLCNGGNDNARISLEPETQSESRNNCGSKNVSNTKRSGLEGHGQVGQQEVAWSGSSSSLAHIKDKGNVWREWQLGFAQKEYDHRRGPIDGGGKWWETEPNVGRVDHGVAARVDRLKAIGNGQVPLCAASAWRLLSE